jgi:DNA-directed RNA polymerase specialized sigma24 family protein
MPLPAHLKAVIDLRVAGLTQGEIATRLNVSISTVGYRYRRALMLLSTGRYLAPA